MDVYVRLSARSAEEAFRSARGVGGGAGFALDADLVTGLGAALVGALDELGPVMVVAAVSGAPEVVGTTAARLARLGAVWVTVAAAAGAEATRAAVDAVAGTGCGIVVHTLGVGLDEAAVGTLTGSTRGRMVSRLAASAAGAGAAAARPLRNACITSCCARRKLSIVMSRAKRAYTARECDNTMTKQHSCLSASPTFSFPKRPQSTWASSPGSVSMRKKASVRPVGRTSRTYRFTGS